MEDQDDIKVETSSVWKRLRSPSMPSDDRRDSFPNSTSPAINFDKQHSTEN